MKVGQWSKEISGVKERKRIKTQHIVSSSIKKKEISRGKKCLLKSSRKIALTIVLAVRSLPSAACGGREGNT